MTNFKFKQGSKFSIDKVGMRNIVTKTNNKTRKKKKIRRLMATMEIM